MKVNCHLHTNESDGELSPRDVVENAIERGLTHICFTDHFKIPAEIKDYGNDRLHSDGYYEELESLRIEFVDRIEILIGVELDWIDGHGEWIEERIRERDYDFILGSVHWVQNSGGGFERPHFPKNDIGDFDSEEEFVRVYLAEVKKMICWGVVDSVAHFDFFRLRLFGEDVLRSDWYKEEVLGILELMREKGLALEINCAGFRSVGEQFPQRWVVGEAIRMGIGVTLGNDFHKLEFGELDEGISEAVEMLREVGCSEISVFRGREAVKLKI